MNDFDTLVTKWVDYFENDKFHIVTFNETYLMGYYLKSKRTEFASFISDDGYYSNNLLSHMDDNYQIWVNKQLELLNYSIKTIETEVDYYDEIKLD